MLNKPLVTVVTITFNLINANRQDTFVQCVESVNKQSYKNIEHIIIDGASTDGTVQLLEEYSGKGFIKYFSQPDKGIYDAMNKGIEKANGKYIAFLNSDDFYNNEDAIKLCVEALESQNADWSYANTLVLDEKYGEKSRWRGSLDFIPFGSLPNHQTIFAKTEVLRSLGGFDLNYPSMADNQLMMKLHAKDYKPVYVDETIITFRTGGFSSGVVHDVKKDHIECFYDLYKDKLNLTNEDCTNLYCFDYLNYDINQNIDLCVKLGHYPQWQKLFLQRCMHRIQIPDKLKFYWFKKLPVFKIKKYGSEYKMYFIGLPVFKLKFTDEFAKFYICGIRLSTTKLPKCEPASYRYIIEKEEQKEVEGAEV